MAPVAVVSALIAALPAPVVLVTMPWPFIDSAETPAPVSEA